jgi:hypothetical protein
LNALRIATDYPHLVELDEFLHSLTTSPRLRCDHLPFCSTVYADTEWHPETDDAPEGHYLHIKGLSAALPIEGVLSDFANPFYSQPFYTYLKEYYYVYWPLYAFFHIGPMLNYCCGTTEVPQSNTLIPLSLLMLLGYVTSLPPSHLPTLTVLSHHPSQRGFGIMKGNLQYLDAGKVGVPATHHLTSRCSLM